MHGVRLSRSAGSPLIHGSMRPRGSFARDWLLSAALAFLVSYVSIVIAAAAVPGSELSTAVRAAWIPCMAGSVLVSLPAVTIARRFWPRHALAVGAFFGVAASFLSAFWFARFLVGRLGG